MRIIADTATLFAPSEGEAQGMTIIPVCVAINHKTYKDYAEISSDEFLKLIEAGGIPSSSQPALGDLLDVFESDNDEMLVLTVGDGLSGAYQTAMGARSCIESSVSFVIPEDFEFLKRSGRLTPITAKVGGVLKLLPVLTQTEDKTRIKPVAIKRTWKAAVDTIIQRLETVGVNQEYLISVSHAGTYQKAVSVLQQIKETFTASETELLQLSPALITHGGPGCIVVQAIRK